MAFWFTSIVRIHSDDEIWIFQVSVCSPDETGVATIHIKWKVFHVPRCFPRQTNHASNKRQATSLNSPFACQLSSLFMISSREATYWINASWMHLEEDIWDLKEDTSGEVERDTYGFLQMFSSLLFRLWQGYHSPLYDLFRVCNKTE